VVVALCSAFVDVAVSHTNVKFQSVQAVSKSAFVQDIDDTGVVSLYLHLVLINVQLITINVNTSHCQVMV
jgi:hypothetical protein